MDCLQEWGPFIKLAIPSMLMLCLEWWLFEVGGFLAGVISEAELGAQSIAYELSVVAYMVSLLNVFPTINYVLIVNANPAYVLSIAPVNIWLRKSSFNALLVITYLCFFIVPSWTICCCQCTGWECSWCWKYRAGQAILQSPCDLCM